MAEEIKLTKKIELAFGGVVSSSKLLGTTNGCKTLVGHIP